MKPGRRLQPVWTLVAGRTVFARYAPGLSPRTGPAVVLVHGLAVSSRYLVPTAERLAADFEVWAPDLPGFGRSDPPPAILNTAGLADALAAWMRIQGLASAVLIGNSYGCQIIADLAIRHPDLVGWVVLAGPTLDPAVWHPLELLVWGLLDLLREPPSLLLVQVPDYLRAGPRRTWRTLQAMRHDHIETDLPRVTAPTLVVRGERDPFVSQAWAEQVTRLLPHGRLVMIPNAAHALPYNAPEELAQLVRAFLDDGSEPSAS